VFILLNPDFQVNENDRKGLYEAFKGNLFRLWRLSVTKRLEVSPGKWINVEVHYGGDESWLRTLLGLKKAVSAMKSAQTTTYHQL
jgi:hypothetical protein